MVFQLASECENPTLTFVFSSGYATESEGLEEVFSGMKFWHFSSRTVSRNMAFSSVTKAAIIFYSKLYEFKSRLKTFFFCLYDKFSTSPVYEMVILINTGGSGRKRLTWAQ